MRQWLTLHARRVALMILASSERRIWGTVSPEKEVLQQANGYFYTVLELHGNNSDGSKGRADPQKSIIRRALRL